MVEHREAAEQLLAARDTDERLHSDDNGAEMPQIKAILADSLHCSGQSSAATA
jgi:hypothetical protein